MSVWCRSKIMVKAPGKPSLDRLRELEDEKAKLTKRLVEISDERKQILRDLEPHLWVDVRDDYNEDKEKK